jgi:adenylyltransferase/sulfurtransferase
MANDPDQITATELKRRLEAGDDILVIDVREPHELEISILKETLHIPMGDLPTKLDELEPYKEKSLVILCRAGKRSDRCAEFLRDEGFKNVLNLIGGINAWSDEVDPSLSKY